MRHFSLLIPILAITGCASFSGLDGKSSFSCKAPDGVSCSSLSGIYANAKQENLPGLRSQNNNSTPEKKNVTEDSVQSTLPLVGLQPNIAIKPLHSGDPIYTQPKVMRVWLAPWEDQDGDFHDQSYIYMVADYGRWVIGHNQHRIMEQYQPTNLSPVNDAVSLQTTNQSESSINSSYNQRNNTSIPEDSYNHPSYQSPSAIGSDNYDLEGEF